MREHGFLSRSHHFSASGEEPGTLEDDPGSGEGWGTAHALPQAWLEVGASTAPSWLPMLAAPVSSTVAPTRLTQHTRGWKRVLSLYHGRRRAEASPCACVAL